MYQHSYHDAVNHLVSFGAHGGDTQLGRDRIAKALRDLRTQYGAARALRERNHMRYITGMFPIKEV